MSAAETPSSWQRRPNAGAKLPDYAHPPLVQVRLGVQFDDHVDFTSERQCAFEQELGPTWQQLNHSESSSTRYWSTRLGDQGIVFSGNSLSYSWDGHAGDLYPHYPLVREGFVGVWNAWCKAVSPMTRTIGWRVTYINRITQGTVWSTLADCSFFRWLAPLPDSLPTPTALQALWRFPLERFDATLTVELDTTLTVEGEGTDPPRNLYLTLRCTGGIPDPDDTFLAGFDYGREVIVRTFRQLMQPAANEFWGLKA
ncbi:MAG TPA: hypothetical protein VM165_12305 [Planctomycetaceae bacterium]|nr:hypothetical protein [Planctomycetaceae bacterium]